jgi:hypothetical protein
MKMDIIPDIKKYEQRFEDEYHRFVSELNEHDKNIKPFSKGLSNVEGK